MRHQAQQHGTRPSRSREKNAVYASLRGCWDRISARIREVLDSSDPNDFRVFNRPSNTNEQSLPEGFQKRKTAQGQVYFLHTTSGQKTWYDPRVPKELLTMSSINIDSLVGKLSSLWEVRVTSNGKCYFVNHLKKTTQFTDPRLVANKEFLMSVLNKRANNHVMVSNAIPNNCHNHRYREENRNYPEVPTLSHFLPSASNSGPLTDNKGNSTLMSQSSISKSRRKEAPPHYNASQNIDPPVYSLNNITASSQNQAINTKPPNSDTNPLTICPSRSPNINSYSQDFRYRSTHSPKIKDNSLKKPDEPQSSGAKRGKELFDKITILRQELHSLQVPSGPCRIEVSRKSVFEHSYRAIMILRPKDLRKRLMVKFRGEEGLDYGGVAREWLYLLSREMLNPNYGLFQYTRDDIYSLQINPDSGIAHQDHLLYLKFCGRIMGLAIFHGHHLEGCFTLPFYKMILNKQITLKDIEHVDPELYRSLCWMLSNQIEGVIDTTFSVEHNAYGVIQVHELKEGGKDIPVTEENKEEYVALYVNYRYRMGIEQQFKSFQKGFYELIPPHLVQPFDERELEVSHVLLFLLSYFV